MLMKGCKAGRQGEPRVACPSVVVSAAEEQQRFPVVPGRVFLSRQHSSTVSHQSSCQGGPQPVTLIPPTGNPHRWLPTQEWHKEILCLLHESCIYTDRLPETKKISKSFTRKQSCLLHIWSICLQGEVQRRSPKQHQKQHMGKVHLPLPRKVPALLPVISGKLWYEIGMALAGSAKKKLHPGYLRENNVRNDYRKIIKRQDFQCKTRGKKRSLLT